MRPYLGKEWEVAEGSVDLEKAKCALSPLGKAKRVKWPKGVYRAGKGQVRPC